MTASNRYPTAALRASDSRHYMHPYTEYKALAEEGSRIIVKAKGVWLEDSDGKKYLDGMAGLWCSNVGHGREEIAEAVYEQMKELAYYNSFFKTSNPGSPARWKPSSVSLTPRTSPLPRIFVSAIIRATPRWWPRAVPGRASGYAHRAHARRGRAWR
jgi:adenosylmethionine-8-amino-7-oxononanoate aminotransferase